MPSPASKIKYDTTELLKLYIPNDSTGKTLETYGNVTSGNNSERIVLIVFNTALLFIDLFFVCKSQRLHQKLKVTHMNQSYDMRTIYFPLSIHLLVVNNQLANFASGNLIIIN